MFPYKDDNPTVHPALVTIALIIATTAIWIVVQGAGSQPAIGKSVCELGAIPAELLQRAPVGTTIPIGPRMACEITGNPSWYTVLSSMFLHGGWFHLIGNMWFLW